MNTYKVTQRISLKEIETKEVIIDAEKQLKSIRKKLGKLQDTMFAHGK